MTKAQIKVFEELLNDKEFKGKEQLRWLLWRNTNKPKYEVGESHIVTDRGHCVYGIPVRDFKATITRVYCFKTEREYHYELEAVCKFLNKETTIKVFTSESKIGEICKGNINVLGEPKSKYEEETHI